MNRRHPLARFSTRRHAFALSRRISPELCFIAPPSLGQEGAGKAGCRLAPTVRCARVAHEKMHSGIQVQPKHSALPAQWPDGLCRALPGAEFLLASLTPRIDDAVRPVGLARTFATGLTVATTARTTRFCRTRIRRPPQGSPAPSTSREKCWRDELSAPLIRTRFRAHRDYPPCPHHVVPTLPRPPQPGSRKMTTHDRPSRSSRDGRHIRQIRISVKRNISARTD